MELIARARSPWREARQAGGVVCDNQAGRVLQLLRDLNGLFSTSDGFVEATELDQPANLVETGKDRRKHGLIQALQKEWTLQELERLFQDLRRPQVVRACDQSLPEIRARKDLQVDRTNRPAARERAFSRGDGVVVLGSTVEDGAEV